jgi:RNA polymerase sigma factor (sigma-70 family)
MDIAAIMATETDEFIPTRRTLLSRLRNWQDQESWAEFFGIYGRLIYGVARKTGLTDAEAQDVVQETVVTVAKQMPAFHYDPAVGSFKSWLLQITRSRINDAWRKKFYDKNGRTLPREETLGTTMMEGLPAPPGFDWEAAWNVEWGQTLLQAATARVKPHADPAHYQMFYLHVEKQIPAKEVARRLNVPLMTVYYAKREISKLIRKQIAVLEKQGW